MTLRRLLFVGVRLAKIGRPFATHRCDTVRLISTRPPKGSQTLPCRHASFPASRLQSFICTEAIVLSVAIFGQRSQPCVGDGV